MSLGCGAVYLDEALHRFDAEAVNPSDDGTLLVAEDDAHQYADAWVVRMADRLPEVEEWTGGGRLVIPHGALTVAPLSETAQSVDLPTSPLLAPSGTV